MESPTGLQSNEQAPMTHAVEAQPNQPTLSPSNPEPGETEYGTIVRLDVVDLAAPDDDY